MTKTVEDYANEIASLSMRKRGLMDSLDRLRDEDVKQRFWVEDLLWNDLKSLAWSKWWRLEHHDTKFVGRLLSHVEMAFEEEIEGIDNRISELGQEMRNSSK